MVENNENCFSETKEFFK